MNNHTTIADFLTVSVIGKGNYAKVLLVRHIDTKELYALKVLKKKYIVEKQQEVHIMTEREILAGITHPFLVKMKLSFQDSRKLYFLLQYCPGGELFSLLTSKDKITEEQAKFYSGQIILALEELHRNKVVYRDLKPENIMIDTLGYVKLTDFGLSKILVKEEVANSIVGTPEYLAPEIVRKEGHGVAVDWWCLGCLIHEMLTGYPPFKIENKYELYEAIAYKSPDLTKFSNSPKLLDLLRRLLVKEPAKRLGSKGAKEIKEHPWFDKLNWEMLYNKKIRAPFVPKLKSKEDLSYFDGEFTKSSIESGGDKSPMAHNGSLEDKDVFMNFSYE